MINSRKSAPDIGWNREICLRNISSRQVMALRSWLDYTYMGWSAEYVVREAFQALSTGKGKGIEEALNRGAAADYVAKNWAFLQPKIPPSLPKEQEAVLALLLSKQQGREVANQIERIAPSVRQSYTTLTDANSLGRPILVAPALESPLRGGRGVLLRESYHTCIEAVPLPEAKKNALQTLEGIGELLEKGAVSVEEPLEFYANLLALIKVTPSLPKAVLEKIERGVLQLERRRANQIIGKLFREAEMSSDRCGNWLLKLSFEERLARYKKLGVKSSFVDEASREIKRFQDQFTAGYIQATVRDLFQSLSEQSLKWHLQVDGLDPKTTLLLLKNVLDGMNLPEQRAFLSTFQCPAKIIRALDSLTDLFSPETVEMLKKSAPKEESPEGKTPYNVSLGEAHARFAEKLREVKGLNDRLILGEGKAHLLSAIADDPEGPAAKSLSAFFQTRGPLLDAIAATFAKNERLLADLQAEKIREKNRIALENGLELKGETATSFAKICALKELYQSIHNKYVQVEALLLLLDQREGLYCQELVKLKEAYRSILELFTKGWNEEIVSLFALNSSIASVADDSISTLGIPPANQIAKREWNKRIAQQRQALQEYENRENFAKILEEIRQRLENKERMQSLLAEIGLDAFLVATQERQQKILELFPDAARKELEVILSEIRELEKRGNGKVLANSRKLLFSASYNNFFEQHKTEIYYNRETRELREQLALTEKEHQYGLYYLLSAPQLRGKEAELGNLLVEGLLAHQKALLQAFENLRLYGSDLKIQLESERKMGAYEEEMGAFLKQNGYPSGDFRNYNPFVKAYQTITGRLIDPLRRVIENCISSSVEQKKKNGIIFLLSEIYVQQGKANSSSARQTATIEGETQEKKPSFLTRVGGVFSYFRKRLWTQLS